MVFRKKTIRGLRKKRPPQWRAWAKDAVKYTVNALQQAHRLMTLPVRKVGERAGVAFLSSPLGSTLLTYSTVAALSWAFFHSPHSAVREGVGEPEPPTYTQQVARSLKGAVGKALSSPGQLKNPDRLLSLNRRARRVLEDEEVKGRDAVMAVAPFIEGRVGDTFYTITVKGFREGRGPKDFEVGRFHIHRENLNLYDPIQVEGADTPYVVVAYKVNVPLDVFTKEGTKKGLYSVVASPYYPQLYHPSLAEKGLYYFLSLGQMAQQATHTPAEDIATILIIEHIGHRVLGDTTALVESLKELLVGAAFNPGDYKTTAGSVARGLGQFTRWAHQLVVEEAVRDLAALGKSVPAEECLYNNYCTALMVGHYLSILRRESPRKWRAVYPFVAYNGGRRRALQVLNNPDSLDGWIRQGIYNPFAGRQYETSVYYVKAQAIRPLLKERVEGTLPAVGEDFLHFRGAFVYVGRSTDGAAVYRVDPRLGEEVRDFLEGHVKLTDRRGRPYRGKGPLYAKVYPVELSEK